MSHQILHSSWLEDNQHVLDKSTDDMFPELDGYATLQDKLFARDNQDANMEDEFEDCTLSSDDPGVKKLKAEEVSTSEMSSEEISSDDPGLEKVLNVASHTSSSELSPAPEVP